MIQKIMYECILHHLSQRRPKNPPRNPTRSEALAFVLEYMAGVVTSAPGRL